MLILQRPGTTVTRALAYEVGDRRQEIEGVAVHWKVPDVQTGKQILQIAAAIDKDDVSVPDAAKILVGLLVEKIDGVKFADGSPLELKKDQEGHLTDESVADCWKLLVPLLQAAIEFATLAPEDLGNSRAPQPTTPTS